jgi:hypothetical protein
MEVRNRSKVTDEDGFKRREEKKSNQESGIMK